MVAVNGENTAERPMWTEKGGLDFEGRAKWDAWAAVKGTKPEKAKLEFVRVRTYAYHIYLLSLDVCPSLRRNLPGAPNSCKLPEHNMERQAVRIHPPYMPQPPIIW
jgi:hypothetical protein